MITETVATISGQNVHSAEKFGEISERLEFASSIQDIDELKRNLGGVLKDFRSEMLRQKQQNDRMVAVLQGERESELRAPATLKSSGRHKGNEPAVLPIARWRR